MPAPTLQSLGRLWLQEAPGQRRPWAAASGLVLLGRRLLTVADDEPGLLALPLPGRDASEASLGGRLLPLLDGARDVKAPQAKSHKADLEALCRLPSAPGLPWGALLALGSGSTPQRERGALWRLGANARLRGRAQGLDLAPLYAGLRAQGLRPNIEGACVQGDGFYLAQRGDASGRPNVLLHWPWPAALRMLQGATGVMTQRRELALGQLDGVPLGLTDLAPCPVGPPGALAYCAAAEDRPDSYADGPVLGSVLGLLGPRGEDWGQWRLPGRLKVEGLALRATARGLDWWLVTDADDPSQPAELLRLRTARPDATGAWAGAA